MERCNIQISLRDLIIRLMSQGLAPNYTEVIDFIDNNKDDDNLFYLFYALDYIKEDSLLLKLKIEQNKLNKLIQFLDVPQFLIPQEDGFIHINAASTEKIQYYKITPDILNLLKIDNINYPEKGDLKEYYEFTYETKSNGEIIEHERILQFDYTGKIIKILSESQKKILEEKKFIKSNKESAKSIYNGIVGELFEDLLKTN